ncbi:hypothetical protein ASG31_06740 [Chryseobacterium sp. Leaf404]|uniref:hypothetical protein n=1 Tax=unclassified Chryseobacterium TaxID=2593645 RepID=UPI0006FE3D69|nr:MULTISPECIES: hypothetical protein [unclassified Chryseobacterium]KQT18414.1 hypothetical protein ASG31_06740 [Chryseobacterium sp. Leaf404]
MKTLYQSKNGKIELKIVGYDEPNNGRSLHIAELYIQSKDYTSQYFENGWNRLNFNLDDFQFESADSKFIFIPAEGNSFLINTNTFAIIKFPFKAFSTFHFKKNEFLENSVKIYYSDETLELNLPIND